MNNGHPTLEDVKILLPDVVLLPINSDTKRPIFKEWQLTTFDRTQDPDYQRQLEEAKTIGVLLGPPSGSLAVLDCDSEAFFERMTNLNPFFRDTFCTHGKRPGSYWFRMIGDYPEKVLVLSVEQGNPLGEGLPVDPKTRRIHIGEFRGGRAQSIICGRHPSGCPYTWPIPKPPTLTKLIDFNWPDELELPWNSKPKTKKAPAAKKTAAATPKNTELLQRAIAALPIPVLWDHFKYSERSSNPTNSPFREDVHPSFSIFEEGAKWKDHATGDGGDSFDFYQRALKLDASAAFRGFIELAGLGRELKKAGKGVTHLSREEITTLIKRLAIYYDPDRSCYWTKNDRDNWIKINASDVLRHLDELDVSDSGPVINAIQRSMDVEYVASLAGYQKGIFEYRDHRLLVLDSPVFIQAQQGDWSILNKFLHNLLGAKQCRYLYGWLKVTLEALYNGKFRPGQALVLAGPKDCGKSLLQNLLTILFGGRSAKPHQYMIGLTAFNGDLFNAEHLMIEDEEPSTDIRSRRNFGTKVKEITANTTQRCHFKHRNGISLEPFWRLTISLNDETENLMILPPWDNSIEDKMILLKASSRKMPMPTRTNDGRAAFWNRLVSELPAFVHFLFNWEIPKNLLSDRYGVTHYQHPDILDALRSLAPEIQLLELIDSALFRYVQSSGGRRSRGRVKHPY